MNRLWKATAMMAVDKTLLDSLDLATATVFRPAPFVELQQQPVETALESIRNLFLKQGLLLCLFDLAEINRWLKLDKEPNHDSLIKCGDAIKTALGLTPDTEKDTLLEAAGLLILDKRVRQRLLFDTLTLSDCGYTLSEAATNGLMSAAMTFNDDANTFFNNNWPGTNCQSALNYYSEYVHFNI